MKKYIFAILFSAVQFIAIGQTVNVHFKNGQTIKYPSANVDYVDFSAKPTDPAVTAGQVVDLGLSVYWASCNLGAENPEDSGNFYAWGETYPKNSYSASTYSYYDSNTATYTNLGYNIGGTEYDAATVNLGSDWRMPTIIELEELINNCTWEWTQINNVNGYKVIGTNGNSIFLPAAGRMNITYNESKNKKYGVYLWSANNGGEDKAMRLWSYTDIIYSGSDFKWFGFSIRPVTKNFNSSDNPVDHSQDYLVTENVSASFTGGSTHSINGVIQSGSVLNVKFTNESNEPVTLVGVQINDAANGNQGNNVLEAEIEVAAGGSKSYSITLGMNVTTPVVCFTYRYNKKNYKVEATWSN
jgi:hypothetical protein